jgi:carboxylesterase type B
MSTYWVHFATTGDPNGGDLPHWPPFSIEAEHYIDFGDVVEAKRDFRSKEVDVYSSVIESTLENTR